MLRRPVRAIGVALTLVGHAAWARLFARGNRTRIAMIQFRALRRACQIMHLTVESTGSAPSKPGLIVANHSGVVDPFALGFVVPAAFAAMARMRKWPVIGWVCQSAGVIFVDRSRKLASRAFADQVERTLSEGVSVVVFPEGTTTGENTIKPFKTGAFASVSNEFDLPVIPAFIRIVKVNNSVKEEDRRLLVWAGGQQSFPAHIWQMVGIESATMEVRFGTPISSKGKDRKQLAAEAFRAVDDMRIEAEMETITP